MSILEELNRDRAKFVSVYDLVTSVAKMSSCSISDAACAVSHVIENKDIDFLSRKAVSKSSFEVIGLGGDLNCLEQLEIIASKNDFPTEVIRPDSTQYVTSSFNNGWYKSDLRHIFLGLVNHGLRDFTNLPCMVDHHISPSFIDWLDAKRETFGKEAIRQMEEEKKVDSALAIKRLKQAKKEIQLEPTPRIASAPPYLDPSHPCYSRKLAAAINAWQHAVAQYGKSQITPTQIIDKWLIENANSLGFELSEQAKKNISSVANYRNKSSSISPDERLQNARDLEKYNNLMDKQEQGGNNYDSKIPF